MNNAPSFPRATALRIGALVCAIFFSGCEFDVPLTVKSTRPVQQKLIGDWTSVDGKDQMRVRQLDVDSYAIAYNGELYRAHHSDFADTPFVSVLHLDAENRKYAVLAWELVEENNRLRLRVVSSKVVATAASTPAALQKDVERHLGDTALFEVKQEYIRNP